MIPCVRYIGCFVKHFLLIFPGNRFGMNIKVVFITRHYRAGKGSRFPVCTSAIGPHPFIFGFGRKRVVGMNGVAL